MIIRVAEPEQAIFGRSWSRSHGSDLLEPELEPGAMILGENLHGSGSGRFEKKAIKNSKIVFFQTFSSAFFEILS